MVPADKSRVVRGFPKSCEARRCSQPTARESCGEVVVCGFRLRFRRLEQRFWLTPARLRRAAGSGAASSGSAVATVMTGKLAVRLLESHMTSRFFDDWGRRVVDHTGIGPSIRLLSGIALLRGVPLEHARFHRSPAAPPEPIQSNRDLVGAVRAKTACFPRGRTANRSQDDAGLVTTSRRKHYHRR